MVIGDLSSCSLYGLFQRELQVELSILQGSLVKLRKHREKENAIDMMLLSSSAIFGVARLVDLLSVAKISKSIAQYLRGARENDLEIPEEDMDILLEAVKMLVSLYVCREEDVDKWVEDYDEDLKGIAKRIKAFVGFSHLRAT